MADQVIKIEADISAVLKSFEDLKKAAVDAGKSIKDALNDASLSSTKSFAQTAQNSASSFKQVTSSAKKEAGELLTSLEKLNKDGNKAISDLFRKYTPNLQQAGQGIGLLGKGLAGGSGSAILGGAGKALSGIAGAASGPIGLVVDGVTSLAGSLFSVVGTIFGKIYDIISGSIGKVIDFISGAIDNVLSIAKFVAGLGAAAAGYATYKGVQGYSELEQNQFAIKNITGDEKGTNKLIKEARQFANITPESFKSITDAARNMIGFGFSIEEIMPNLKMLGDISAATGSTIDGLSQAFSKVKANGRLMGIELNQFTRRGVPLLEALAKTMDKPKESIRQMVRQGQVSFEDLQTALRSLTQEGGQFNGMVEAMSQTLQGRWMKFSDTLADSLREMGGQIAPALKVILNDMTSMIPGLQGVATSWGKFVGDSLMQAWKYSKPLIQGMIDFFSSGKAEAWFDNFSSSIKSGFETVSNYVNEVFTSGSLSEGFAKVFGDAASFMLKKVFEIGVYFTKTLSNVFSELSNSGVFESLGQVLIGIGKQFSGIILMTFDKIMGDIIPKIQMALGKMNSLMNPGTVTDYDKRKNDIEAKNKAELDNSNMSQRERNMRIMNGSYGTVTNQQILDSYKNDFNAKDTGKNLIDEGKKEAEDGVIKLSKGIGDMFQKVVESTKDIKQSADKALNDINGYKTTGDRKAIQDDEKAAYKKAGREWINPDSATFEPMPVFEPSKIFLPPKNQNIGDYSNMPNNDSALNENTKINNETNMKSNEYLADIRTYIKDLLTEQREGRLA